MAQTQLPITVMCQEQTEWCWAAVASAVSQSDSRATPMSQCEIVAQVNGFLDCCSNPSQYNVQGGLPDSLASVGLACNPMTQANLAFSPIARQITANRRPIAARIEDKETHTGHNVLIVGCDDQNQTVLVSDPWGTIGTAAATWSMPFRTFATNYGDGAWGECTDLFLVD